jgi:hypothetical protein
VDKYYEWKNLEVFKEDGEVDEVGMRLFWDAMRRMSGGAMHVDNDLASDMQLKSVVDSVAGNMSPMQAIASIAMAAAHHLGKHPEGGMGDKLGRTFGAGDARNAFANDSDAAQTPDGGTQ